MAFAPKRPMYTTIIRYCTVHQMSAIRGMFRAYATNFVSYYSKLYTKISTMLYEVALFLLTSDVEDKFDSDQSGVDFPPEIVRLARERALRRRLDFACLIISCYMVYIVVLKINRRIRNAIDKHL